VKTTYLEVDRSAALPAQLTVAPVARAFAFMLHADCRVRNGGVWAPASLAGTEAVVRVRVGARVTEVVPLPEVLYRFAKGPYLYVALPDVSLVDGATNPAGDRWGFTFTVLDEAEDLEDVRP
jgi:hypothetical protein